MEYLLDRRKTGRFRRNKGKLFPMFYNCLINLEKFYLAFLLKCIEIGAVIVNIKLILCVKQKKYKSYTLQYKQKYLRIYECMDTNKHADKLITQK